MAIVKGSVQDELVIVSRGKRSRFAVALLFLLSLLAAAAFGYFAGFYQYRDMLLGLTTERDVLSDTLQQSQAQLVELRKRLVIYETSEEIDRISVKKAQDMVLELESQNAALEQEVAFYRNIMAPESASAGLVINSIDIQPTDILNVYRYSVVLAQLKSSGNFVNGRAQIQVEGLQNEQAISLNLNELETGAAKEGVAFKFRYFEELKGTLTLPDGFIPKQVLVVLQTKKKNSQNIEKTQIWNFEGDL